MKDLILAALDQPHKLPPEAFESPRIVEMWGTKFAPPRSARSLANFLGSRPPLLPPNLTPTGRTRIVERFGPAFGTAILAATQDDPDLIEAAVSDSRVSVRSAVATNPHLPVAFAESLYNEMLEFASPSVILRPGWEDYLSTPSGAALAAAVLLRSGHSDNWLLGKAFCEAYPQVRKQWLEARVLTRWPATPELVRESYEVGIPVLTLDLIAQCSLSESETRDLLVEYLEREDSPSPFFLYTEILHGLRDPGFEDQYTLLSDLLLSLLTEREIDDIVFGDKTLSLKPLSQLFTRVSDRTRLAQLAFSHTLLSNSQLSDLIFSRPDWFEMVLDCVEIEHKEAHRMARRVASLVDRAVARLISEYEEASSAAQQSAARTRLLALIERLAGDPIGLQIRTVSSALHPQRIVSVLPPQLLADSLSERSFLALAAQQEWREVFSAHLDKFESHFSLDKVAPLLNLSSKEDLKWLAASGQASEVLSLIAQSVRGQRSVYGYRPLYSFWAGLASLDNPSRPPLAVSDADRDQTASLIVSLLSAAPDDFWAHLLWSTQARSRFLTLDRFLEMLPVAELGRILGLLVVLRDEDPKNVQAFRQVATPLNKAFCQASGLEPLDAARATSANGLPLSRATLGIDLFSRLGLAVASRLGAASSHWDAFLRLGESWPDDLDSLLDFTASLSDSHPDPDIPDTAA